MSLKLVLLASYPKSGNTWLRLVLENLRASGEEAVSINDMGMVFHGFGRRVLFDTFAPVNAADLTFEETENLLPDIFRQLSAEGEGGTLVKVHDFAHRVQNGEWLYPPECIHSVIYLVRHPFDVVVSFAHHMGISPAETVNVMAGDESALLSLTGLSLPLPQRMGSWSTNVLSWLGATPYRVSFARYEDLHADPVPGFLRLAAEAGVGATEVDVARAVEATRFDRLQKEESQGGFRERPKTSTQFFRSGKPRSWEGQLDQGLRDRLVQDHGPVMARLGYMADGSVGPFAPPSPQGRS